MLELLQSLWGLVLGLLGVAWDLVSLLGVTVWDLAYHLHVNAPRLEGLLVGVALAWLMTRRDRHPLMRVLSSPLKLIVDILDLAWDQLVELVKDSWAVVTGWVRKGVGLVRDLVVGVWSRGVGLLTGLRDRLRRGD
jgi:hypothetical protein